MSPNRKEIQERMVLIFREVFDDETIEVYDSMSAHDVEDWDSLNHITLVVNIEKEFGLKLNAAEVGGLENVGEMIKLLEARATR